jgi:DNA-binding CsgD family transcriptional regulator
MFCRRCLRSVGYMNNSRNLAFAHTCNDLQASSGAQQECSSLDADELLLDAFTRARRRFRGAIVGMTDRTIITNTSASELLQPGDRRTVRQWMRNSGSVAHGQRVRFELANGMIVVGRCYPVGTDDQLPLGIVIHLEIAGTAGEVPDLFASDDTALELGTEPPVSGLLDPTLLTGWLDLTDSERSVAELVGQGLSNREAGRRLFLSRHTVDYHLRRVFRKLGVKSRVELARILGEHYESLFSAVPEQKIA